MPSPIRPSTGQSNRRNSIDRLEYQPGGRPLLSDDVNAQAENRNSQEHSYAGSFFENVVDGIVDRDRELMKREVIRYISFIWANINCLGAGSISTFSLYGPLLQSRLHYTQLQVNGVSITAELAMYLTVPLWGYLCDRYGPGTPSVIAGFLFAIGYSIAAFAYKSGPSPDGWPYWVMVVSYIPVGSATACMMLSSSSACAKNFGRAKYRGLALATPIACFGLSGMWLAQVGSKVLYEPLPDGGRGDVDVHRYFLFLGIVTLIFGIIGYFALRIVGEGELIEEAIEELEQSGLLEDSEFFQRMIRDRENGNTYGTMADALTDEEFDSMQRKAAEQNARRLEEKRKKTWLLNAETKRFLLDRNMWWLAAGFFLVTGPGECFINNFGSIIGALYTPSTLPLTGNPTSAATHVSIFAVTSTLGRFITGGLTDVLAPSSPQHQHRRGPNSLANSMASLYAPEPRRRFEVSRVAFLITFCIIMSIGQVILASGVTQQHAERFWLVTACIGTGYGAIFSLAPITISVVWGVENFGTNWGILATVPAAGAAVWGLIYSAVYQWAAQFSESDSIFSGSRDLCFGPLCYTPTFWGMAVCVWVACGFWFWAWKGPGGWSQRGIAV